MVVRVTMDRDSRRGDLFPVGGGGGPISATRWNLLAKRARGAGKRMLVAEDEVLVPMAVRAMPRAAGTRPIGPVRSVDQALEAIAGETLNAVLLDGDQAGTRVDAVAAALTRGQVPFGFVTFHARDNLPAAFLAATMPPKPFSEADLVAAPHGLLAPTTAGAVPLRRSLGGAGYGAHGAGTVFRCDWPENLANTAHGGLVPYDIKDVIMRGLVRTPLLFCIGLGYLSTFQQAGGVEMPTWEDRNRNRPAGAPPLFAQSLLRGPVDADLREGEGQPTHDFSPITSDRIFERLRRQVIKREGEETSSLTISLDSQFAYAQGKGATPRSRGPVHFDDLVQSLYFNPDTEELTISLFFDIGTASKQSLARQIRREAGLNTKNGTAIFAWPSERPENTIKATLLGIEDARMRSAVLKSERSFNGETDPMAPLGSKLFDQLWMTELNPIYKEYPVDLVISTDQDEEPLNEDAWLNDLDAFLSLLDSSIYSINLADKGSWLKRLRATTLTKIGEADFQRTFQLGLQAAEDYAALKTEAPLNAEHLKITERVLSRIASRKRAVVVIGTLAIVKNEDEQGSSMVIARRLSQTQLSVLEARPIALSDPLLFLEVLSKLLPQQTPFVYHRETEQATGLLIPVAPSNAVATLGGVSPLGFGGPMQMDLTEVDKCIDIWKEQQRGRNKKVRTASRKRNKESSVESDDPNAIDPKNLH